MEIDWSSLTSTEIIEEYSNGLEETQVKEKL